MGIPLQADQIRSELTTGFIGEPIIILKSTDSTNDYALDNVNLHGAVVLAEEQTAGKGRMGRNWISPRGKSVLMTVVFLPEQSISRLLPLTLACGVAVAEGLQKSCNVITGLKWPNDVILNGRKVSGVLVESQLSGSDAVKVVTGLGINVSQQEDDFPDDLRHPATSLQLEGYERVNRNSLIASVLNALESYYIQIAEGDTAGTVERWKQRSLQLNTRVRCSRETGETIGTFVDLAADGAALVKESGKDPLKVSSGEIFSLE